MDRIRTESMTMDRIPSERLESLLNQLTIKHEPRNGGGIRDCVESYEKDRLWCCIASIDSMPIGWVVLDMGRVYYSQIYVKAAYRGQGIGTLLMKRAVTFARRRNKRLHVGKIDRSQRFYEKVGQTVRLFWHPATNDETAALQIREGTT